jgi:hypothetical protein
MTSRASQRPTVVVEAWQNGGYAVLDWSVYRSKAGAAMKRRASHRRVHIRIDEVLQEAQLTVLVQRMAVYVLASLRGHQFVPRHLPWMEVGATEWSVPPGGGEGGANRKDGGGLTEGTI